MSRVLLLVLLFMAHNALGQAGASVVTMAQLDKASEQANNELATDNPQRAQLLQLYDEVRAALIKTDGFEQDLATYQQALEEAESKAQAIQAQLLQDFRSPESEPQLAPSITPGELEKLIQVDKSELLALHGLQAEITAELNGMPARATTIRDRLIELGTVISKLAGQSRNSQQVAEPNSEAEARLWLERVSLEALTAEKAALDKELVSQSVRQTLLKAQQDKGSHDIGILERRLEVLERRANVLRRGEVDEALAQAEKVLRESAGKHALVLELARENVALAQSMTERNAAIEDFRKQDAASVKKADTVESDLQSIQSRLNVVGMNLAVGGILREQSVQLPTERESDKALDQLGDRIDETALRRIELEEERRKLRDPDRYVSEHLAAHGAQVASELEGDVHELTRNRRALIRRAMDIESTYAQVLGDLDFSLRRYALVVEEYREFISERLLWIPSRETFSIFQGGEMSKQLGEVFAAERWARLIKQLPQALLGTPLALLAILLVLLFVSITPRLERRLRASGSHVGYVHRDQFSETLMALAISFVLALKWPLLMVALAWLFEIQDAETELAAAVFTGLLRTSFYFWGLEFLRMLLVPKGLTESHFRWPTSRNALLSQRIVSFEISILPAIFTAVFCLSLYPREVGGPLGSLAVACVMLSIAYFFYRMPAFFHEKFNVVLHEEGKRAPSVWATILRHFLTVVPLLAIGAVVWGYTYTAVEIALLLIDTVVLFSLMLLLHELGMRWLGITRRRMIVKVRDELAQSAADSDEESANVEILENDPELLNYEGTRLLNVMLLITGVLLLLLIWAEIFPALAVLDSVELWHQTSVVDGIETSVPVTPRDILSALLVGVIGWVALRRIPSLLEILLRQRMHISPPSAYAATRVFQYAATTLLVVLVLSLLGGRWTQIQWAVAALSVGIGFGLQEIVANFISGLIILFEQPIRLGDTVTVGDVSGKVTKIRIRATTIRDFDRRELLVPNKEFITGRLLNWTLTDPVTRRQILVGVAYGTDVGHAMAIIAAVARDHPLVLVDPEPLVTFDDFGDNSLLLSLLFFMDNLDQRLIVTSELRVEINRRFNEAGIVVAFPQRDVHLDASEPLRITMVPGELGQGR